jgi:hypothetical protein
VFSVEIPSEQFLTSKMKLLFTRRPAREGKVTRFKLSDIVFRTLVCLNFPGMVDIESEKRDDKEELRRFYCR